MVTLDDFVIQVSFHDCLVISLFACWHVVQNAGSERCCEALQKLRKHYDIVVNIQGDEPLIEPEIIDGVVMALQVLMNSSFVISYSSDKQNGFPEVTEMKSS